MPIEGLLRQAAARAERYLASLDERPVFPAPAAIAGLRKLAGPLPEDGDDPLKILSLLDEIGSPAAVASAGGRYFGFVTGGALPATVAANWMAGAWDQNAFSRISSPLGATLDETSIRWLIELLCLPGKSGGALVTGATMANFTALAAARHAVLSRAGWDVEAKGLIGAPPITIVVGDEVHMSLVKALGLVGLGRETALRAPVDGQGRMRADALPKLSPPAIVCLQAGNVNSGAFDPAGPIIEAAHNAGAWVHVDGAFGLWAAAAPGRRHLVQGYDAADSWALDCHKWLNVPYDCGFAAVREPSALAGAMSMNADYLLKGAEHNPFDHTPECSRRMRGAEVWAAVKFLGRQGIAEMVERNCRQAKRFAEGLAAAGFEILNEVELNQVLVSFGDDEATTKAIAALQAEGVCWCGGTVWQGRRAMRISVSSWATTDEDIELSLAAMIRAGKVRP